MRQLVSIFILNRLDYCNSLLYDRRGRLSLHSSAHRMPLCGSSWSIAMRPRQFTPNVTLASYLLLDPVQDCAADMHCIRWPVSGVRYIKNVVAPVTSHPGRQQLLSAARSDFTFSWSRTTKVDSRAFSIAGPEVWNRLPLFVRSAITVCHRAKIEVALLRTTLPINQYLPAVMHEHEWLLTSCFHFFVLTCIFHISRLL